MGRAACVLPVGQLSPLSQSPFVLAADFPLSLRLTREPSVPRVATRFLPTQRLDLSSHIRLTAEILFSNSNILME